MKKVYRVLCEVSNLRSVEKYDTYVFANDEKEARNLAVHYWNSIAEYIDTFVKEVELICEDEFDVIGAERVY